MKTALILTCACVAWAPLHGAIRYVNVHSANPSPPYLDWSSAAASIQDAVDVASPGDEVVVTNGVYQTGSRQIPGGSAANRIMVKEAVTVRSVNGPGVTVIRGEPGDPTRKWSGMRCAHLAGGTVGGAVLVGFTLTNGESLEGGGVYGGTLSNCVLRANTAVYGGGAASCRLVDCLIEDNSAEDGGGAWNCELVRCAVVGNQASVGGGFWGPPCAGNDGHGPWGCPPPTTCIPWGCSLQPGVARECTFVGNVAHLGAGAYGGWLDDCTLTHNSAQSEDSSEVGRGGGAASAWLRGCLIRNNRADSGGGAFEAILHGCVVTGNSAVGSFGGGARKAWLSGCTLSGNAAAIGGGGASTSTLENCVLTSNAASEGGGAWGGSLSNCTIVANAASNGGGGVWSPSWTWSPNRPPPIDCDDWCDNLALATVTVVVNCIVYDNTAPSEANHAGFTRTGGTGPGSGFLGGTLSHSCTTPLPTNSVGNITNAPLFVDAASGNFRLQSDSPCINSGRNAFAPAGPDSDGNPRIAGGTVDIGAYELQSPQSVISYAWRQHHLSSLPPLGLGDFDDADSDGQNNWQEWRAGTNPRDAFSVLRLLTPLVTTDGLLVRWQSLSGQNYFLERSADLGGQPTFVPWASNIVGQADVTIFADTNALGTRPRFYRVGVHE